MNKSSACWTGNRPTDRCCVSPTISKHQCIVTVRITGTLWDFYAIACLIQILWMLRTKKRRGGRPTLVGYSAIRRSNRRPVECTEPLQMSDTDLRVKFIHRHVDINATVIQRKSSKTWYDINNICLLRRPITQYIRPISNSRVTEMRQTTAVITPLWFRHALRAI